MENLSINLEPRIVLPKDENGDTYIGVYIDDELVLKIAVGRDSASSVTLGENSLNTIAQNKDKKNYIRTNEEGMFIVADTIKFDPPLESAVKTWCNK